MSICVDVNLGRILTNLNIVRFDAKDKLICSVVKANAYGHGIVEVANSIETASDYFAVATVEEGVLLRKSGIKKPILSFCFTCESLLDCINYDITIGVCTLEQVSYLVDLPKKPSIHIQIDTGMGRFGLNNEKELSLLLDKLDGISVTGVYSHLYSKESFYFQLERLKTYYFP